MANFVLLIVVVSITTILCVDSTTNLYCSNYFASKRIVAFGDSLTKGFVRTSTNSDVVYYSYALRLMTLLPFSNIIQLGLNGEQTQFKEKRLNNVLYKLSNEKTIPDVVIIWGGTNDIFYAKNVKDSSVVPHLTTRHIISMHKFVNHFGAMNNKTIKTIAITIPWSPHYTYREVTMLQAVNKYILAYARDNASNEMAVLDMENEFNSNITTNLKYWSADLVHYSKEGYIEIANKLFDLLCKFAKK